MKTTIITFTVALIAAAFGIGPVSAATPKVSDLKVERDGKSMSVSMTVNPKAYKLSLNREVMITPVIWSADSTRQLRLPSVEIAGKNIYYYNLRNNRPEAPATLYRAGKGKPAAYEQRVAYEPWMETSTLGLEQKTLGCCGNPDKKKETTVTPVAMIDYRPREFKPVFVYTPPTASGDKIIQLEGKAFVDFPVNRTEIYPDYRKNPVELKKIISTVDEVKNNKDASVQEIFLKGFASPEGPWDNNVRLAKGRTQALKEYVRAQYDFPNSIFKTDFDPEDWQGLKDSVENSILPARKEILALIDEKMDPDKKDALLRQRFPNDYAYILNNIYPALRHTNYVITYKVRKYTDVDEIKRVMKEYPQNLSLEEYYLAAQSYPAGSKEYNDVFDIAVRMFPNDRIANLNAANASMSEGNLYRAEKYLEKAGNSADAYYARGIYYTLNKKYDEAEKMFITAAEKGQPEAADALRQLADVRKTVNPITYINIK